jgi:hypothetical protein
MNEKNTEPAPEQGLFESEDFITQTINVQDWFASDLSSTGSFDLGILAAGTFGKLLDALPVAAMLVDSSFCVAYANRACANISINYNVINGTPFASLVPRSRNAEKAKEILKKVFMKRKSVVAEAILEMDARKLWGRLHFRSVRIGEDRFVLVVIEDLTSEKTSLLIQEKQGEKTKVTQSALERIIEQRDQLLGETAQKLCEEQTQRELSWTALNLERQKFAGLAGFVPLGVAVLNSAGLLTQINQLFYEWFKEELSPVDYCNDRFQIAGDEIQAWMQGLNAAENTSIIVRTANDTVKWSAVPLNNNEYILICEKI